MGAIEAHVWQSTPAPRLERGAASSLPICDDDRVDVVTDEQHGVYTAYSSDNTYWTLRKRGGWYLVLRLRSNTYEEVQRYGWYRRAGAAATAVGLLSYRLGLYDGTVAVKMALDGRLELLAKRLPKPDRPPDAEPEGEDED